MKKIKFLLIASIGIFTIISCDITKLENAFDNFGLIIGLKPINTSATIILTDAKTGELINTTVETTFIGDNESFVIDTFSDPLKSNTSTNGILDFGINNTITPTEQNPFKIRLKLTAPGYKDKEQTISILETGSSNFTISMVNLSNPPVGIIINESSVASISSEGITNEDINISITDMDTDTNTEVGVNISIPKGTLFTDSNENPLSGELRANTTFYNSSKTLAVKEIDERLLENVNDSTLVVVSAVQMNLKDSSGNSLTSTKNKTVYQQKNTGNYIIGFILNSSTFSELQQVLRLAYISPSTAERFILYTVPEVQTLSNGRVELRYLLNDNLIRNMALVYFSEQPCNSILKINRNGNLGKISIEITEKGFRRDVDIQENSNTTSLKNITKGAKKITIRLPFETIEQNVDLCGSTSKTIDLPAMPPALIDATIKVLLTCPNTDDKLRVTDIPAASVVYREKNAPPGTAWRVATDLNWVYNSETNILESASCRINGVEVGKNYTIKVSYDNSTKEKDVLISGSLVEYNETVDASFCN